MKNDDENINKKSNVNSSKQIDGCLKLISVIKLLLEDNTDYAKILTEILEMPVTDNSLGSVTLSKYINTLRLLGLNVKKEKGMYRLINSPYKIDLNPDEVNAFSLIKNCANIILDEEKTQEEFNKFIKAFEFRFSEKTQMQILKNESKYSADYSFYYDNLVNKIEICSKYCKEDYKVEVIYYTNNKKAEKKITVQAKELIYRRNKAKLQVFDLSSRQNISISMEKIISIKQLPIKVNSFAKFGNEVKVFALKGRLSKNYKPRTWEKFQENVNGWDVYMNWNESENEFLSRMLKYGECCKIIKPKSLKIKFIELLVSTMALYKN